MASKKQKKSARKDVTGLKYFDRLAPLLERLHDDGCGRDKAGNRQLHFDLYCMLVLLYLFNPTVPSMRAIQQAGELKKVQRKLDSSRPYNDQRIRAATLRIDFRFRRIRRSGSRNC